MSVKDRIRLEKLKKRERAELEGFPLEPKPARAEKRVEPKPAPMLVEPEPPAPEQPKVSRAERERIKLALRAKPNPDAKPAELETRRVGLRLRGETEALVDAAVVAIAGQYSVSVLEKKQITHDNASYWVWNAEFTQPENLTKAAGIGAEDNTNTLRLNKLSAVLRKLFDNIPGAEFWVSEKKIEKVLEPAPEPVAPKPKIEKEPQMKKPEPVRREKAELVAAKPAPKVKFKDLVKAVAEQLLASSNKKPSDENCLVRMLRTRDNKYFLVMLGGKQEKHLRRAEMVNRHSVGELVTDNDVKYNGNGDLNCSVFSLESKFVMAVASKYESLQQARVDAEEARMLAQMSDAQREHYDSGKEIDQLAERSGPKKLDSREHLRVLLAKINGDEAAEQATIPNFLRHESVFYTASKSDAFLQDIAESVRSLFGHAAAVRSVAEQMRFLQPSSASSTGR